MKKLKKPASNKKTAEIFKNHNLSLKQSSNFRIEQRSDSTCFVVTNLETKAEYNITLSDWGQHECYLLCVLCRFCVHTFLCSCNDHRFKGIFCVHLHFLLTVKEQLPFFEKPINKRLEILDRLLAVSSTSSKQTPDSSVLTCDVQSAEKINEEDLLIEPCDFDEPLCMDLNPAFNQPESHTVVQDESFLADQPAQDESYESLETSLNNVSRVLNNLASRIAAIKQNPPQISIKAKIDQLYESLVSTLSILPDPESSQSLAGLASYSRKRKISESDKQRTLVVDKSKKPGRKPSKQLKKPTSPEKKDIEESLLKPVIKLPKLDLESVIEPENSLPKTRTSKRSNKSALKTVPMKKTPTTEIDQSIPKKGRGRPPKTKPPSTTETDLSKPKKGRGRPPKKKD